MYLNFFQKTAYRLTKTTVLIAFVLGLSISIIQVLVDYNKQHSTKQSRVDEIFKAAEDSAAKIAFQLDDNYAKELIHGLEKYKLLNSAKLTDDQNNSLAQFNRNYTHKPLLWLTKLLGNATTEFKYPLYNRNELLSGFLYLEVDNHEILSPFYNRSSYVIFGGIIRNLLLASILLIAFHYIVTKPLGFLAQKLSKIKPKALNGTLVPTPFKHERSEIGYIVRAINTFIKSAESYQTELGQMQQQLRLVVDTVPLIILIVNNKGKIEFANNKAESFYNLPLTLLLNQNLIQLHANHEMHQSEAIKLQLDLAINKKVRSHKANFKMDDAKGHRHIFDANFIPIESKINSTLVVLNNITSEYESQKLIQQLAYYDPLTGLANRPHFQQILTSDIRLTEKSDSVGILIIVDLNKFKLINDTLSHSIGDQLLIEVANQISNIIDKIGTVARIGGDEFAISCPNISSTNDQAEALAKDLSEKLNFTFNQGIQLSGKGYQISSNIGAVCYSKSSNNAIKLLQYADAALYEAKQDRSMKVKIFDPEVIKQMARQVETERELQKGLKNEEFTIEIQPIYSAKSPTPVAAEALIRWQHPEKGIVSPFYFLDCVESLNLSHLLSNQVIKDCGELAHQIGVAKLVECSFRFSVNISTIEFYEPDFSQRIERNISQSNVPFELFELEITESIALHDLELVNKKLAYLSKLGIKVALDDFGTGYSSLSYLKQLDINKIKIDKSFVDGLAYDKQDQKLVDSVIQIANSFELDVVVEGVENPEQLEWLSQYSSIWYQGYLFNKPLPKEHFVKLMSEK